MTDGVAFLERYMRELWEIALGGVDALRAWEVDDVRGEFPWGGPVPGWSTIEEHAQVLAALPAHLERYELDLRSVQALAVPGQFVMEGSSGGPLRDGSGALWNGWVSFVSLRDGRIATVREYGKSRKLPEWTAGAASR